MKYAFLIISLFLLTYTANLFSQIPVGYYDSATGLTGAPLKAALNGIIDEHIVYPYTSSGTDVWDILKETDKDPNNAANVILLYTGWSVNAAQEYNNNTGWSREHCWPKSHGFPLEEQPAYTDCHHLRPADISVNSARNARWYGECNEQYFDAGGTIPTDSWTSSIDWVWKPRDAVKGDCARMIFYMATRYEGAYNAAADVTEPDLEIVDFIPADDFSALPEMAILSDLLAWHEQDPVDDFERNRNEVVYSYQGNRNPFIDHPEFVCRIFGTDCPGSVINPDPFTAFGSSPTQIDLSWVLNTNSDNVVVAWNTTNTFGIPTGTYSAGNTIAGGGTVLYVGSLTGFNHTGLSQQSYYYKIWSYDLTPEYSSGIETNCTPIIGEPTNDPTNFIVTGTGISTIDLSWIDASSGTLPAGYLIKASTGVIADPVDGTVEADGTYVKNITQGVQAVNFSGLTASTTYNFKIYPYTNSGINIDYKTNAPLSTSGTTDDLPTACATDLIISEYCEGSSYNKYIEVYNKTGGDVNLDNYRLIKGTNGALFPLTGNIISFVSGAILANDNVYTVSHSSADPIILAIADNTDGDASFNGNDAIALQKTSDGGVSWSNIDVIGVEGVDPGTAWDVAGTSLGTAEHTLVRKESIFDGNTDWVSSSGTNIDDSEWEVYAQDDFSFLGYHIMDCNPILAFTWQGDDSTNPNDWQTAENWDQNMVPSSSDDVTIPVSTNYPIINNGTTTALCNDLNIASGAYLTIASNGQLTVEGTLTNHTGTDGLILQSDINGTGSLIESSITQATCERWLSANAWHFIFSPLEAVNESLLTTPTWGGSNPNLFTYKESSYDYWWAGDSYGTSGWEPVISSADLSTAKGYIHFSTEDKTYNLTGDNLNVGEKVFTCSYTDNGTGSVNLNGVTADWDAFEGWNLIGNPYTSAIDWDQVVLNNVENFVYYYDGTTLNYKYYGIGTPSDQGITVGGGSQYIPANQGFFVKATAPGASVTIPTGSKTHSTQAFWKKSLQANVLRLQINNAGFTDETIIRTLPEATEEHDGFYDAYKFFSYDTTKPMLYSRNAENSFIYAVNTLPNIESDKVVPLGLYIGEASDYTITFKENTFENTTVYLHDIETDILTKLAGNNSYTFNSSIGTFINRFELIFEKSVSTVSDIINVMTVYPNPADEKAIVSFQNDMPRTYRMIDITGKLVLSGEFLARTNELHFNGNMKGLYVLEVKDINGNYSFAKLLIN